MVYAREVGNRELTFAVSGMLWKQSLVLVDVETKSLWSHLLGRAMHGRLKGHQLDSLPAAMTTWKSWKCQYPTATVLNYSRWSEAYKPNFYEDPKRFVLGYEIEGRAFHVGLDEMQGQPVLNLMEPRPHLIVFDRASTAAVVFDRRIEGKTLDFDVGSTGELTGGNSAWQLMSGRAISGSYRGQTLTPIVGIMSFREAWYDFFPDSRPVKLPDPPQKTTD